MSRGREAAVVVEMEVEVEGETGCREPSGLRSTGSLQWPGSHLVVPSKVLNSGLRGLAAGL